MNRQSLYSQIGSELGFLKTVSISLTSISQFFRSSTDCSVLFNEGLRELTYGLTTTAFVSEKLQWPNYQCQFNIRTKLVKEAFKYTVREKTPCPQRFDESNPSRGLQYNRPYYHSWRHLHRLSTELLPHSGTVHRNECYKSGVCDRLQRPRHRIECKFV